MWYVCLKCGDLKFESAYTNKHKHDDFDYFVKVPDKYICYDFDFPRISFSKYKELINEVVKPNPVADINLVNITLQKRVERLNKLRICLQCGCVFWEYSHDIYNHTHNDKYLCEDTSKYEDYIDINFDCTCPGFDDRITKMVSKNPNFNWITHYKARYGDSVFDVDIPKFFSAGFVIYSLIALSLVSLFSFGVVNVSTSAQITTFIIFSLIFNGIPAWFNFKIYSEDLYDYKLYKKDAKEFICYRIKMAQEKQEQYAATHRGNSLMSSTPKCPVCHSTNLSKISNVGKVAKVGAFGILGAGDIGKTWKCNSCGSKF